MARFSTAARRGGPAAVVVGVAVFATAATGAAAPASASDCAPRRGATSAEVRCDSGTSQYRAVVRCDEAGRPDYDRYGEWVSARQHSVASCDGQDRAYRPGYQTR
jgi:hypothetical protein